MIVTFQPTKWHTRRTHQLAVIVQEAHGVGDVQDAHGQVLIPECACQSVVKIA